MSLKLRRENNAISAWLGELCCRADRIAEGLRALEDGFQVLENSNDRFSLPEFHRVKGELLLARGGPEAEACFKKAIEVARHHGARTLQLRAATCLAKLWGEDKQRGRARDLLAPIHGQISEGFDTADLRDATTLLRELS